MLKKKNYNKKLKKKKKKYTVKKCQKNVFGTILNVINTTLFLGNLERDKNLQICDNMYIHKVLLLADHEINNIYFDLKLFQGSTRNILFFFFHLCKSTSFIFFFFHI